MKDFIKHYKLFFVIIFLSLGGCYSSLPIEFSKISDYKELSKIKLKDGSEYYFNNKDYQLLSVSYTDITFNDENGIKKTIKHVDVEKFYTYRLDGTKVLFSTLWIIFGTILLYVLVFGVPTIN